MLGSRVKGEKSIERARERGSWRRRMSLIPDWLRILSLIITFLAAARLCITRCKGFALNFLSSVAPFVWERNFKEKFPEIIVRMKLIGKKNSWTIRRCCFFSFFFSLPCWLDKAPLNRAIIANYSTNLFGVVSHCRCFFAWESGQVEMRRWWVVLSFLPLHNTGPRDCCEPRTCTQSIGLCTRDSQRRPTLRLALHSSYISRRLFCIWDVLCTCYRPWPEELVRLGFPTFLFLPSNFFFCLIPTWCAQFNFLRFFLRIRILFRRRISFQGGGTFLTFRTGFAS